MREELNKKKKINSNQSQELRIRLTGTRVDIITFTGDMVTYRSSFPLSLLGERFDLITIDAGPVLDVKGVINDERNN